jgi:hypothetical protein
MMDGSTLIDKTWVHHLSHDCTLVAQQAALPREAPSWKLGITFNVLLWTQIILDGSLLALWKIMNFFFHISTKN